jgi:glycosyltransferase involved in cell wall biosynthesis
MASGMATVSNENQWTTWLLRDGENALLSPPIPSLVAERIGRLVDDRDLRARIARAGAERVAAVDWAEQIERVWLAITKAGVPFSGEPETDAPVTAARRFAAPRG